MYEQLTKKIMKLMNIKRPVSHEEAKFIAKWKEEYKFKDEIILEAVRRGINFKGQEVSFYYINGILQTWKKRGVSSNLDILALDDEFRGKKSETPAKKKNDIETLKIKYHSDKIERLRYIDGKSDWVDLRAAEDVSLKRGESALISLGISVQIPEGYEMIIAPRSSTFKNFGIIQTNSIGIIDSSFNGNDDIICMPVLAVRDTDIHINNRICQFRILKNQPSLEFEEVEDLGGRSRGGFGSTGVD